MTRIANDDPNLTEPKIDPGYLRGIANNDPNLTETKTEPTWCEWCGCGGWGQEREELKDPLRNRAGIAMSKALSTNTTLMRLDLLDCKIGTKGLVAIANALTNHGSIEWIDVSVETQLTTRLPLLGQACYRAPS